MSAADSDDESPSTNHPTPGRLKVGDRLQHVFRPGWLAWALCLTLLVDGLAVIALSVWSLPLTNGLLSQVFSAVLFALGLANLVALYSLLTKVSSWQLQSTVAQLLIAFLALYIVVTAMQSQPLPVGWLVTIAAAVLGIVAIGWVLLLVRTAGFQWSKTATVIVALFPIGGLVQYWYQSDYLPAMTDPLVDVSTDLSPIGRAEPTIVRLSAKVTVHNRGKAKLYEPAGLMRVSAYRNHVPPNPTPSPDDMQQEIDFGSNTDNVFRANPTEPGESQTLFAEDIAGTDSWIGPDETVTIQREVDLDSAQFRFARLSVTQVFFTDRPIRNIEGPYFDSAGVPTIDYYIGQRSAMKEIVAGYWFLRVQLDARPPAGFESPQLISILCTEAAKYHPISSPSGAALQCPSPQDLTRNNPVLWTEDSAEYGPTDHETNQK